MPAGCHNNRFVENTDGWTNANPLVSKAGGPSFYHLADGAIQISLADDASVQLEKLFDLGKSGIIRVTEINFDSVAGEVWIRGGNNGVNIISDPAVILSVTDVDGKLCFLPDGDGTYTMKNRLGAATSFAMSFMGKAT